MFPVAIVLGNTSVIKPSERDPGACMMLMELLNEAGCPPGVVNVIHGAHEAVSFICDNPDIKAISFVGSDQAVRKFISYILTVFENRVLRRIFGPKRERR
jgi:malonate-semialdehyde dehydrogenase (acetylating)/methylmalonate-semialdehyde dehydrogenase